MTYIAKQKGEVTMYKRTLKTLAVAVVLGVAVPTGAYAMPTDQDGGAVVAGRDGGAVVLRKSGTVVQTAQPTRVVSEKVAGLNLQTAQPTRVVSEKVAGLNLPVQSTQPVAVSASNDGFQWGDFGIGAGVMFGSFLAAFGAAGAVRHYHHGHLAH